MIAAEFKRFPINWNVLPFLEVFRDATSGNTKIKKEDFLSEGILPIVDQGKSQYGGYSNDLDLATNSALPSIIFGDHTRAFKLVEEPFALGADGAKLLEPIVEANKKYLFYYLKQLRLESAGYSRHFKFLKESYIPLPPLPVQKQIAAVLEKADTLRQQCKQMEQELNVLAQSVFLDMFGDGYSSAVLGNHISIITSGSRGWAKHYSENGSRFIRSLDVQMNFIGSIDKAFVNAPSGKEAERAKVQNGDVLLTITGSRIGRVCWVTDDINDAYISQHVALLRLTEKFLPEFVSFFLSMPALGQRQIKKAQYGQTKPGLNLSQIKAFTIPNVPISEQKLFLNAINIHNHIKSLNSQYEIKIGNLFGALMQRAFKGELDLKDVA